MLENTSWSKRAFSFRYLRGRALPIATLAVFLCYCLQLFTPLRINTDAIVLLSMGKSAADGQGFFDDGTRSVFPPGYPAILAALLKLDLASSSFIVGVNLLLLLLGILAFRFILLRSFEYSEVFANWILLLTLLSFVVIKHFPIPLTDTAFFGFAACCVAVTTHSARLKAHGGRYTRWLLLGVTLGVFSILIRRNGIALLPMLLWVLISFHNGIRSTIRGISAIRWVAITLSGLTTGAGFIWLLGETSTLRDFLGRIQHGNLLSLSYQIVSYRVTELGELAANLPSSRVPPFAAPLLPAMGLGLLLLVVSGVCVSRCSRRDFRPVDVFFISYVAILFVWPFYDARFWLPVVPLVAAYAVQAIEASGTFNRRARRLLIGLYLSFFVAFGAVHLGYTTRITFSGKEFPNRYGDGSLRGTYCVALASCDASFDVSRVNQKALGLLAVYR